MKIYQKAKDKNVGANIVYAKQIGGNLRYLFTTMEDAENPIIEGETIVNGTSIDAARELFVSGNMMLCDITDDESASAIEVVLGFDAFGGSVYSSNIEAYCKEMYVPEASDENIAL